MCDGPMALDKNVIPNSGDAQAYHPPHESLAQVEEPRGIAPHVSVVQIHHDSLKVTKFYF